MSDSTRQVAEFKYDTEEFGRRLVTIYDRITVDDVFVFMVDKEIFRIMTGVDEGDEVSREFRDFLVRERYMLR